MAGRLEVDTQGFRKRIAWRGPFGVLAELIANALDEDVSRCDVRFTHVDGTRYKIRVEDDSPRGFRNLGESYTLYADSYKANNPDQRGRFNYGEKVAIVLCDEAKIESTCGTVVFTEGRTQHLDRPKRARGTVFEGILRCTRRQFEEACGKVESILVPAGIQVSFNGRPIAPRVPVAACDVTLATIVADEAGNLIRTERKTAVHVYRVLPGEQAMIYELGIPVVRTGDVFHVDVRQKVPLSVDRNNVTPGYLKRLRAAVLDATYLLLSPEQATSKGVTDGLAGASSPAINAVLTQRFGPQRFVPDFNREATGELTAAGYTAVPTNAFDKETFAAIKAAQALPSGSQLRPALAGPDGAPFPQENITEGMNQFRRFTELLAQRILGRQVQWQWSASSGTTIAQCRRIDSGLIQLSFNVTRLGVGFFAEKPAASRENLDLIFHELGHYDGAMDCTRQHCDGVTLVASSAFLLLLTQPDLFAAFV